MIETIPKSVSTSSHRFELELLVSAPAALERRWLLPGCLPWPQGLSMPTSSMLWLKSEPLREPAGHNAPVQAAGRLWLLFLSDCTLGDAHARMLISQAPVQSMPAPERSRISSPPGEAEKVPLAPTGVDLTPGDALESPGALLPAVALRRLEPPEDVLAENSEAPTYFLCLAADNRHASDPDCSCVPICDELAPSNIVRPSGVSLLFIPSRSFTFHCAASGAAAARTHACSSNSCSLFHAGS